MDMGVMAQAISEAVRAIPAVAPGATWFQSGASVAAILGAFEFAKWSFGKRNGKQCAANVDPKLCLEHIKKLATLETITKHLADGQRAMALKLDEVLAQVRKG